MNELLRRLLHLPAQRSSMARAVDMLHYSVILATMAGVALAAIVTAIFLFRYRRRTTAIPLTPKVRAPAWLELLVIGGLLGLFGVWWVIGFAQYRVLETPPADAIPVYVTAKQWMWKFAYPSGPTATDELVVPVGRPVKLIMTSRDVIHSFYVPEFRIKQDVVPGRAVTTWFEATDPGTYEILCTQYCGTRHSFMRAQVIALAADDYARWLDAARAPLALPGAKGDGQATARRDRASTSAVASEANDTTGGMAGGTAAGEPGGAIAALGPGATLAERGHQIAAERGCLRCHSVDGTPFIGPTWANAFGRRRATADGGDVLVDEAYLTQSMMDPRAVIAAGFAPVMPSYQGALTPDETSAILEYIRALRDVHPTRVPPAPDGAITSTAAGSAATTSPAAPPSSAAPESAAPAPAAPAGPAPSSTALAPSAPTPSAPAASARTAP
ncbi:MAG TPA: cytochrome c oxidase subunit II [Kofleriaceae bacterium]|jgi:cytochrome c oxidase subunit 2|nr:cytochrome c oxidase subunit II [Kofleriaceae bacterium]